MSLLKKSLIFFHRWLGVALCLFFLLWFTSGIVMMYWDFPSVTAQDRLNRSPALDASKVRLSPAEAYAKLEAAEPPEQIRLNSFDGRPVYHFRAGRGERMIYADTGEEPGEIPPQMIQRAAAAWTGQPVSAAKVESIDDPDQWTLEGRLRTLRPLWKYSWPNGEQVYVSEASGEVVQYTTATSRFWAYLGAIPHWLYFTALRKHPLQWNQVVIWTSGIGTIAAILGIAAGIWMYSPAKRYRYAGMATSIPYRGQKRWHMILGLIAGVTAATWAFSGLLSMDPFPIQVADPGPDIAGALRGQAHLADFDAKPPNQALAQTAGLKVKELELASFAGEPVYVAAGERRETRVIPVRGEAMAGFDQERIFEIVKKAAGPGNVAELRVVDEYDAYYLDRRHELPLPVIFVRLNDAGNTRYYIDPNTARVVGDYTSSQWVTRWLYHGLHSLNFPWLYKYRPLWDIVVISLLVGGTALTITSLILAWRVLRRKITGLLADSAGTKRKDGNAGEEIQYANP